MTHTEYRIIPYRLSEYILYRNGYSTQIIRFSPSICYNMNASSLMISIHFLKFSLLPPLLYLETTVTYSREKKQCYFFHTSKHASIPIFYNCPRSWYWLLPQMKRALEAPWLLNEWHAIIDLGEIAGDDGEERWNRTLCLFYTPLTFNGKAIQKRPLLLSSLSYIPAFRKSSQSFKKIN